MAENLCSRHPERLPRHLAPTLVDVITIELPTAGILSVIPCEKRDHCERLTANLCKADYNHKFSDLILTHIPLKTTADHGAVVVPFVTANTAAPVDNMA
ncbi:hypothetical protein TcasGA2_TC003431 [Tribolium castaneum]|uniref:Uncharacterized protein n=1 Tax=Tribolium castaneum TaxID=7070 RepID=D6WGI2_TRICA|nr:hypothetical protein TcasGA2_TC003431 [Tribolium castaneum]